MLSVYLYLWFAIPLQHDKSPAAPLPHLPTSAHTASCHTTRLIIWIKIHGNFAQMWTTEAMQLNGLKQVQRQSATHCLLTMVFGTLSCCGCHIGVLLNIPWLILCIYSSLSSSSATALTYGKWTPRLMMGMAQQQILYYQLSCHWWMCKEHLLHCAMSHSKG